MNDFYAVGTVDEFADPSSTLVEVDDEPIVLIHAAGTFYALDDVCTHDGGPLSDGPLDVEAKTLGCVRHGAKFSLADGAALSMPATKPTRTHEVRIQDGSIFVRLCD